MRGFSDENTSSWASSPGMGGMESDDGPMHFEMDEENEPQQQLSGTPGMQIPGVSP